PTGGTAGRAFPPLAPNARECCHGCGQCVPKPLWQRWHHCDCGIGPIQRDLSSAFLAASLDPQICFPRVQGRGTPTVREGAEPRLQAAYEFITQRAREGQSLPRSVGMPSRQSASAQKSTSSHTRAHSLSGEEAWETWKQDKRPPWL